MKLMLLVARCMTLPLASKIDPRSKAASWPATEALVLLAEALRPIEDAYRYPKRGKRM